jgi:hypothetical protein
MTKKPTIGRPKLPAKEKRDILLQVRLSEVEKNAIEKAANGRDVSTWAREFLLLAAHVK